MEHDESRAYTIKLSYANEFRLAEQIFRMNKSKNLGEFINAVGMRQFMPQNVMYGDVYGNMYYVRTGRVPIRPDGYDWQQPVPGNTSATEWLGIHGHEDLVQILNPPANFMQNCNISPGTMTTKSPLTPDRYLPYLYRASENGSNSRGRRFMEIMEEMGKITEEDAHRIATDIQLQGVDAWQKALADVYAAYSDEFEDLAEAVEIIGKWDRRADIDSIGMTLFFAWWEFIRESGDKIPADRIRAKESLSADAQQAMLKSLGEAASYMKKTYGSIQVPWGNVHRFRRGGKSWPLPGVAKHGLVTLRAVGGRDPDENGIIYGDHGQFCTTLIMLKQPVRSYSAFPFGQSEDPDSPHYTDQAEKLFSKGLLKPTWYQKEELLKHIESKKTLIVP